MYIHISKRIKVLGILFHLSLGVSQKNLRSIAVGGLKILKRFHKPKSVKVIECEVINDPPKPSTRKINHGF